MIKTTAFPLLAVLLFVPAAAHAQELGGWRGLDPSSLDTVYVTDDAGQRTEGKLLRFDPDALVILVDGMERKFDRTSVLRIDRRGDSLKNGAVTGAVVGALMGWLVSGMADCPSDSNPGGSCGGSRVAVFAVSMGLYTAVGTGIDAMIVGRTRVFDAGRATAATRRLSGPQLAFRVRW